MQELTLVGVHEDGDHLVLTAGDGQRFRVRVDEALRVAVRRDRARLGQIQIQADGHLRPREIQARIRSGQTAEEVAEAAGVPVEHVRRYEGPVLAEREFVVRQARSVRVRRHGAPAGAGAPTLEELVHTRLMAREVDEETSRWDAWRSEDGTWVVALSFTAANRDRRARWAYDVQLRHVAPLEDEARWLTDDEPEAVDGRRLAPVRGRSTERRGRRDDGAATGADGEQDPGVAVYDIDADGGVRTADDDDTGLPPAAAATVDLLDTLRERRGRRQRITLPDDDGPHRADGASTRSEGDPLDVALDGLRTRAEALGDPPAAHPPRSRPELARDAELLVLPDAEPVPAAPRPTSRPAAPHPYSPHPSTNPGNRPAAGPPPYPTAPARGTGAQRSRRQGSTDPGPAAHGAPAPAAPPPQAAVPAAPTHDAPEGDDGSDRLPSRRARRASVPSWDDIVFGSRRE